MRYGTLVLLVGLVLPDLAAASGFSLIEQSASAVGRGSTACAHTDEPAAAWYNPAAIPFGSAHGVALTGMLYAPGFTFAPATGGPATTSDSTLETIPALDGHVAVGGRVQLSFALHVPFAMTVAWPEDWVGARHALSTRLWVLAMNPSLAVRVHPRLALAVGFSALRGDVEIATGFPPDLGDGRVDLSGATWSLGINLGVLYRPWSNSLRIAATYRSQARLSFTGRARFAPEVPTLGAVAQEAHANITLPDIVTLGAKVNVSRDLALLLEIERTFWSTFDRLAIEFEKPNLRLAPIERGRLNPWSVRGGVEWPLRNSVVVARAGVGFEQSTATPATLAPSGPDARRVGWSLGLGYQGDGWGMDVGYKFTYFLSATAQPPGLRADGYDPAQGPAGTYHIRAHLVAMTLYHRREQ